MSQRDIARELNLSQMQVSRLLKRALNTLYDILQSPDAADEVFDKNYSVDNNGEII
mgnify:CR=1 FL=1